MTVEAYTASWIEISVFRSAGAPLSCRGLYSLVDWNSLGLFIFHPHSRRGLYSLVDWNNHNFLSYALGETVEAYTASWIEMDARVLANFV